MTHKYKPSAQDQQVPQSGKVENDSNKQGKEAPTQKNEGRRTPQSRHDREAKIGGNNQSKMRGGSPQGSNTASPPNSRRRG